MRRYLVVAHQTLGSPELLEALGDLAAEGPAVFHLVVPEYHGGDGLTWTEGQVRAEAARQLEAATLRFLGHGLAVTGEVGDASPVQAVEDVILREGQASFAGIVVSTLPHAISNWLRIDAPSRVERRTGLPVIHVVGHRVAASA
jgi:GABA permease